MKNEKPLTYFKNLDGLRFIAATFVIIGHSQDLFYKHFQTDPYFPFANKLASFGVDFFFVLSGFLISYLLFIEIKNTGTIHIKHFYIRRMLRLWPLYFLVGVVSIVTANYVLPYFGLLEKPQNPSELITNLLYLVFFSINFQTLVGHMNPASSATVGHFWSLSIEEQFYLLWAPLLRGCRRFLVPFLLAIISIGLLITLFPPRIFELWFKVNAPLASYFFTLHRFFHFGLGAMMAWLVLNGYLNPSFPLSKRASWLLQWCFILPFCLYLFGKYYFDEPIHRLLNGMASAALIAVGISPFSIFKFEYKWLKYLGKISFGIYIFHIFGVHLSWHLLIDTELSERKFIILFPLLAAAIAIGLAALSYESFEKYFLKLKTKFK